jgi:hypothetical protein
LRHIQEGIETNGSLSPEERLDLVFLPLMRHRRTGLEVVNQAIAIAQQLPDDEQGQVIASLIGLGKRFLNDAELNSLMEGLMKTNIGEMLIERGVERGFERAKREDILTVLAERFGEVPDTFSRRILDEKDPDTLQSLLKIAAVAPTLDAVLAAWDWPTSHDD